MKKNRKILEDFNPNANNGNEGIFGLPFGLNDAKIVILPVPWEVSVSYREGTSKAPKSILKASYQIDLVPRLNGAWKRGIHLLPLSKQWKEKGKKLREKAKKIITEIEKGNAVSKNPLIKDDIDKVNKGSVQLNSWVKAESFKYLAKNKIVGILGGDHSSPLGLIQALTDFHKSFTVLQIDAHADLRERYEFFEFSHASIMYNVVKLAQVKRLVQVGIRDFCIEEQDRQRQLSSRIKVFSDQYLHDLKFKNTSWAKICEEIIDSISKKVYISFDIDGLQPELCPNTGTPVPGGLTFSEVSFFIELLVQRGIQIIGFDLCEVGFSKRSDWDANVGARILFELCSQTINSNE